MQNEIVTQISQNDELPSVNAKLVSTIKEATPWVCKLIFDKIELEPVCNHWWNTEGVKQAPQLVANRRANQKRNGIRAQQRIKPIGPITQVMAEQLIGKWSLYQPVLQHILARELTNKIWPNDLFYMFDYGLLESDATLTLTCRYFTLPSSKCSFEFPIKVSPKPTSKDVETYATTQKERLRQSKSQETEKVNPYGSVGANEVTSVIEDGDVAVVTIHPTIDGKPWAMGTITNSKLRVVKGGIRPDTLRKKLEGLSVGNHHIEFELDDMFDVLLKGKTVVATVIIHSVLRYILPDWSDELAKELGFESIADLDSKLEEQAKTVLNTQWEEKAGTEAVQFLIMRSEFDPIPSVWVQAKVQEQLNEQLRKVHGNEQKLIQAYNVKSKEDMLAQMAINIQRELLQVVTLKTFGKEIGLERNQEEELSGLSTFLTRSAAELLKRCE